MGHLDPFFQELNGIGILALIVTIIAVIVRVVFCKTMRARIYTGVLGLISAIVMSLGIDYAIRPFAGTGESTATNGLGFVQLMIGVVIALIGGAVLRGILSHDDGEPQPTSNSLIMDTQTELNRLAPRYGLVAAMSNEDSYYGWFMIDHDNGGSPDPLYEASLNANLQQERQLGKLYGDPGSGLDYSAFGNTAVQAGQQGESALARIIAYMQLNVISFWSLYGLTRTASPSRGHRLRAGRHRPATAGACLVRGREELQGRQRHQIREPGSTKPGAHEHQPSSPHQRLGRNTRGQDEREHGNPTR